MGGNMSDLFYPDNPYRRSRAQQLSTDARFYISGYEQLKAHVDAKAVNVKEKMNQYLKNHGYDSFAALDAAVRSKLVGEDLEKWHQLNERLMILARTSITDDNVVLQLISTISGVGLVAGAVAIGGLVALGIMTGPVGWSALGIAATVAGIIFVIDAILGAILGAEERAKLRQAINDLSGTRLRVYHAYRSIQMYDNWIANFDKFLNMHVVDNPAVNAKVVAEMFEETFGKDLQTDIASVSFEQCWNALHELDRDRHAWMEEDPSESQVLMAVQMVAWADRTNGGCAAAALTQEHALPEPKPVQTFEVIPEGAEKIIMQLQLLNGGNNDTTGCVKDIKTGTVWSVNSMIAPGTQLEGLAAKLSDFHVYLQDIGNPENRMEKCRVQLL